MVFPHPSSKHSPEGPTTLVSLMNCLPAEKETMAPSHRPSDGYRFRPLPTGRNIYDISIFLAHFKEKLSENQIDPRHHKSVRFSDRLRHISPPLSNLSDGPSDNLHPMGTIGLSIHHNTKYVRGVPPMESQKKNMCDYVHGNCELLWKTAKFVSIWLKFKEYPCSVCHKDKSKCSFYKELVAKEAVNGEENPP